MPVMEILFEMERNGVLLDLKLLETQSRELAEKMLLLENRACTIAGQPFNLNSTRQIQEILFNQLKLPVLKKTPGGAAVHGRRRAAASCAGLPAGKSPARISRSCQAEIHLYGQASAHGGCRDREGSYQLRSGCSRNGRLASNEPNLQNIPVRTAEGRRIREAFIAPPATVLFRPITHKSSCASWPIFPMISDC